MVDLPRFVSDTERAKLCVELRDMGYSEDEAQSMIDDVNMTAQDARDEHDDREADERVAAESARDEYEAACTQTFQLNLPGAGGLEYDPYF